jgi:hypothetical protein
MGCGGQVIPSPIPPTSPLHGGILVPLPEKLGYVELLNDSRQKRYNATETNILAYLLGPDQKTALVQKPTSVSVQLDTPSGRQTVPMLPNPDPGDPAGSARFGSEFGLFELNQRGGEITVAIDGKTLTVPFRGPR